MSTIRRREFLGGAAAVWSGLNPALRAATRGFSPLANSARGASTGFADHRRELYLTNEAVKVKPAFLPLPAGAVTPQGWLRDWAVAAAGGITGHLDDYAATFGQAWEGHWFNAVGVTPNGGGWPLEQCSYWLDGAVRLGYILNDSALIAKVTKRLDRVVDGVLNGGQTFIYWLPASVIDDSAGAEGRFNNWAHSHMGRALVAYYQASGNPRVLEALVKVYSNYTVPAFSPRFDTVRGGVNLDAMLDTFVLSGEPRVLRAALAATARPDYRETRGQWAQAQLAPGHNVIYYEHIRVPSLLYPWTGAAEDLASTEGALAWGDQNHLLPMGLTSGEEYHAGVGSTRNVETCDVAASLWTFLHLLRITGEGKYSDRIEQVFFNAGPAPVARDFQTASYYQSANRYSTALPGEAPPNPGPGSYIFSNLAYRWVLCCVGNLNRVVPNYLMHMWMSTLDGGLAATLYGPSTVRTTVGDGVPVEVAAHTAYPFSESINLVVNPTATVTFPLYLRVPGWCGAPRITLNGTPIDPGSPHGGFVKLARAWKAGDRVELRFPMLPRVQQGRETSYPDIPYFQTAESRGISKLKGINSPFASVHYGPLLFALPIPDASPNQERPGARYQFALDVRPEAAAKEIAVVRRSLPEQFAWPLEAPVQLSLPVREVDWQPSENVPLPGEPLKGGRRTTAQLTPYGCTKFRVSMFPVTESAWKGEK